MDVDPDSDNGKDEGAVEIGTDDEFDGTDPGKKRRENTGEDDSHLPSNLHPADPGNFLKLCSAVKLLCSRSITEAEILEADALLRAYCKELVQVRSHVLYAISPI